MKSLLVLSSLTLLASLQTANCLLNERYLNSSVLASSVLSTKVSSSTTSTITPKPTYCGNCTLYYEVHAHIWWSTIFTTWAATWLYTVDKGSGSTIGSSLHYPLNTTAINYPNFTQYIMNRDGGAIEYTTFNTLAPAQLTTIIAENEITMTGPKNVYVVSTSFYNETLKQTVCKGGAIYYAPLATTGTAYNKSKTISTVPGVPASTTYTYTTSAFNFGSNWTLAVPLAYGLDSLATAVGSVLSLSSACVIGGGGGVGTLKVGVTALTTSSNVYVNAQPVTTSKPGVIAPTPTPTPSPSPTSPDIKLPPDEPKTSPSTIELPPYTPSTAPIIVPTTTALSPKPTPSIEIGIVTTYYITTTDASGPRTLAVVTTLPPGVSTLPLPASLTPASPSLSTPLSPPTGSYTTTYITTITNSILGLQTLSVTATLPLGSVLPQYTTTLVRTSASGTGSVTVSEVVTLPVASYILSLFGVGPTPTPTTTNSASVGVSGTGTSTSSAKPLQVTGAARRREVDGTRLGVVVGVGALVGWMGVLG